MTYDDINKILDSFTKQNDKKAKELLEKLQKILENGGDTAGAFKAYERDFWADFKEFYNKATNGEYSIDELKSIRAGQITLSSALYARLNEVKNSVNALISKAKKENKSVGELAKMLYEGYNFKADPLKVKTKFPKYLWQECAQIKIKNIKTPALRASYKQALQSIIKQENLKALKIAGYEKARYYANRIALNETSRAYNDNRALEYARDTDIKAVKIKMSKTHPRTDICDYFANVDKYGLGAGVYPKDKAPIPPFHPFCRCAMIPKYADEYGEAKLNKNADKEYLDGLKDWQKASILGSKAKVGEALKNGDITAVFNAMKSERYKVKSISEIVKEIKNSTIIAPMKKEYQSNFNALLNASKSKRISAQRIGDFSDDLLKNIEKIHGEKLEDIGIFIDKGFFIHASKKRKGGYNQALSDGEIAKIPLILAEQKSVSYDTKEQNIVFWFDDLENSEKINKIVVKLNYKLGKNGVLNYIRTAGKIEKHHQSELRFVKIR